jgi:NAD(P) transhydrogenase subunit alpha
MEGNLVVGLYIFMLAVFAGYQVISKVPQLLHTPLMAFTNAISGISLVASIVLAGRGQGTFAIVLGVVAVAAAMINVVGGFLITDRMLRMMRKKEGAKP